MAVIIGISTSLEKGQQRIDHAYVRCVAETGGLPVLLPTISDPKVAAQLCTRIDGLVVPGGPGITHNMAGTLPEVLSPVDPLRWASDTLFLQTAYNQDLPVLGICYGMQLMGVMAGGALYADAEQQHPNALVHSESRGATMHTIRIDPNTHLHRLLQVTSMEVNTRHLQALRTPGTGYRVSACSPDGIIEAIENAEGTRIGVQFHPERMNLLPLFRHLIDCAAEA